MVEKIWMPSGVIVCVHDDYADSAELAEKRLTRLSEIVTKSHKQRAVNKTAQKRKFRDN